ncbi:MAG: phosphotransferase [Clostridia bacterium]|nr:phosphotransferase [Clostridia bacterium]
MRYGKQDERLVLYPEGRLTSNNAESVWQEISRIIGSGGQGALTLDCEKLEYVSSAGLRLFIRLKKTVPDMELVNVSSEIYDILEMTGLTEMITTRKSYRTISVEGCDVIGRGANGNVYRIDRETVVKVFLAPESLDEIHRERELARTALIMGVPTAIPYDVVRIESGGYGSVFELIEANSFSNLIASGRLTIGEAAKKSIDLLKEMHTLVPKADTLPRMKDRMLPRAQRLRGTVSDPAHEKLVSLIEAVPDDPHLLHGDYHINNILQQKDELMLIDMDTLCTGHPIFELALMRCAYRGFTEMDHAEAMHYFGISYDSVREFWRLSLEEYIGASGDVETAEKKAELLSCMRLLDHAVRKFGKDSETGKKWISHFAPRLEELAEEIDELTF